MQFDPNFAVPLAHVLICAGAALFALTLALLLGYRARKALREELAQARADGQSQAQRAHLAESRLDAQAATLEEVRQQAEVRLQDRNQRVEEIESRLEQMSERLEQRQRELAHAQGQVREITATLEAEKKQSGEKLALLSEAKEQLSHQFKVLASEILDDKSKKFTELNQTNLGQLLNPLQERLKTFQSKVEEVYVTEGKERSALVEQVRMLTQLNHSLSEETQNLTLALKGDRKAQGNWGEIILDDVLEKAGLLRGQHYVKQGGVSSADGRSTSIPDVVITLPGERHLVVDSKLTLPDYRAYSSSEDDGERAAALKRHLNNIRAHIKGLSEKQYQSLYDLKSLDFVVMFIPLEPAFTLAVTHDNELFQHAWEKNVLLVSPSTLLFVVRTVAYLWRQEGLSRNAQEISSRGGELYDKLVGFVADLQKVGDRLDQAQSSYGDACKKLSEGRGNVIRQAEMLRELGIKASKELPSQWVEEAIESDAGRIGENPDES